jgi:glyoxylase-like metal-dependent hydrolase (beta-lactamase superfamily II)
MVTRLETGVWWVNLTGVNAYIVDDGGTLTLVDAGMPWQARAIARDLSAIGEDVGSIDRVLLTHYDVDHVGGLTRLAELGLDAPIYIGRGDESYFSGRDKPDWDTRKGILQRTVGWLTSAPPLPVEPVADGNRLGSFTAYSTPGHTPGHVAYVSEELSLALLGDLVRESGGDLRVPPALICQDHERTKQSVVDLSSRAPPFEIACPGHGVPFVNNGHDELASCAERVAIVPP